MRKKLKNCSHVLTNGELCNAIPLRDSNFCYWHHKARARRRRHERIGGPISMDANSGLELPLLEDSNAIQIAIQEIMQAILDRRIDNKRAGLLLYSLQAARTKLKLWWPIFARFWQMWGHQAARTKRLWHSSFAAPYLPAFGKCGDIRPPAPNASGTQGRQQLPPL